MPLNKLNRYSKYYWYLLLKKYYNQQLCRKHSHYQIIYLGLGLVSEPIYHHHQRGICRRYFTIQTYFVDFKSDFGKIIS